MNPRTAKQELAPQYRVPKLVLRDPCFGSGNRGLAPKNRGLRTPVFNENWCCGTPSGGVVGPPFLAETGVWEHHEQIQEKNNSIMGEREREREHGPAAPALSPSTKGLRFAWQERKQENKKASIPVKPRRAHPAALHRGAIQQAARRPDGVGPSSVPIGNASRDPGPKIPQGRRTSTSYQEAPHHVEPAGQFPHCKTPAPVPETDLHTEMPVAVGLMRRTAEGKTQT